MITDPTLANAVNDFLGHELCKKLIPTIRWFNASQRPRPLTAKVVFLPWALRDPIEAWFKDKSTFRRGAGWELAEGTSALCIEGIPIAWWDADDVLISTFLSASFTAPGVFPEAVVLGLLPKPPVKLEDLLPKSTGSFVIDEAEEVEKIADIMKASWMSVSKGFDDKLDAMLFRDAFNSADQLMWEEPFAGLDSLLPVGPIGAKPRAPMVLTREIPPMVCEPRGTPAKWQAPRALDKSTKKRKPWE